MGSYSIHAKVYSTYLRVVKTACLRFFLGRGRIKRTQDYVESEYTGHYRHETSSHFWGEPRLERLDGRYVLCRAIDHRKHFLTYLQQTISALQPERVLEIGSGSGINLLALAAMNPQIKTLRGVELTATGVARANQFLSSPPQAEISYLTGLSEDVVMTRLQNRDIKYVQGSALELPWPDDNFDFCFSLWVLEQIPRDYHQVFREVRRVLHGHALFLEHFTEAQLNIFERLHLANVDYFRASYREVEKAGLEILQFGRIPLSRIKNSSGALLCSSGGLQVKIRTAIVAARHARQAARR